MRREPSDLALRHQYGSYALEHGFPAANDQAVFSDYAGTHLSYQHQMRRFAELVNDVELAKYIRMETPSGKRLTWSFMRRLLGIPSSRKRIQIAERAAREDWSVGKMNLHISSQMPMPTKGAGRRRTPPGTPEEAAALVIAMAERAVRVVPVSVMAGLPLASREVREQVKRKANQLRRALNTLVRSLNVAT